MANHYNLRNIPITTLE